MSDNVWVAFAMFFAMVSSFNSLICVILLLRMKREFVSTIARIRRRAGRADDF